MKTKKLSVTIPIVTIPQFFTMLLLLFMIGKLTII